jgi:putative acetyltransferase
MRIRQPHAGEEDTLGAVMYAAISRGPSLYSEAQRHAWLARPNEGAAWSARLASQHVLLAEAGGKVLGFVTLGAGGYVDLAFVRPAVQRRGVFRALLAATEDHARGHGLPRLWTNASLMARPAFEAAGFHVIRQEKVTRGEQVLDRAEMEKPLQ